MIKVSTIKLREDNPRMITEAAIDKLGESISRDPEYMVIRPIVIDEDRVVLGGNARLKAIIKLGMKTVPDTWVVQVKDWPEEKRKRFILVDNSPEGMSGTWDRELLMAKWDMMELEEVGIDTRGFEIPEENKPIDEEAMGNTKNECPQCGFTW